MTKGKLIKLNKVIGFFYSSEVDESVAVINLAGAPGFGDSGNSKTAQVCNSFGVSYLSPDYIGMCRSGGEFNFKSSVETIYECVDFLTGKFLGTDIKTGKKLAKQKFNEIILLGSSFGGSIAPFVEKFKKTEIKKIILVAPVTDWITQNNEGTEEPINEFLNVMSIGMKNVWRGFSNSEWPEIIKGNIKEMNPIDNTNLLADKEVFILHGNKDKSISWKDSEKFFEKIKNEGLVKNVFFEKLKNFGHSGSAVSEGVKRALRKIRV